jgi:hypothetical protein
LPVAAVGEVLKEKVEYPADESPGEEVTVFGSEFVGFGVPSG